MQCGAAPRRATDLRGDVLDLELALAGLQRRPLLEALVAEEAVDDPEAQDVGRVRVPLDDDGVVLAVRAADLHLLGAGGRETETLSKEHTENSARPPRRVPPKSYVESFIAAEMLRLVSFLTRWLDPRRTAGAVQSPEGRTLPRKSLVNNLPGHSVPSKVHSQTLCTILSITYG